MTAIFDQGISDQALANNWKSSLLTAAVVLGWVIVLYWKTAWSMVSIWESSQTFAHGFLVPPIALWLAWRQRASLEAQGFDPSRRGAWVLLLPLGFGWLLGELTTTNAVSQLAYVGLLVACVPALLGWAVAKSLAFPLGFLFFAVPIGAFLTPLFMDWTARFTVLGLRLSGVPVYQDGLDIVIPSGNWSVAEACSGIRYLIASVMVGSLFAYLYFRSLKRRLAFVAVSMVVPVVANWVRAYMIVMIGHLSSNRLATGVDHVIYGWLFFGVVVTVMFLIGSRWADVGTPDPAVRPTRKVGTGQRLEWSSAGLVALLATWPVLAMKGIERFETARPPALDKQLDSLAVEGWRGVDSAVLGWRPNYKGAADVWHQAFEKDGQRVGLYLAYYRNQGLGRKLISSANPLVHADDKDWAMATRGIRRIGKEQGLMVNVVEVKPRTSHSQAEGRLMVWQWYWIAGRMTANVQWAKAYTAWSRLIGRGDDSAVIVLYAPVEQAGGGEVALEAFNRSAEDAINHLLIATWNRK